jgi:hypothetical protein
MLGRRAEPCGHQQRAELVAVQRDGMGLVIQVRSPRVGGWGMVQEFLLGRVFIESGCSVGG